MPDFLTLQATYPKDDDYPPRTFRLAALGRVVQGTLYDSLTYAFDEEKNKSNEYIPLAKRRPSARTRICRTVVNDSVSLLFSEGHFPKIEATDEDTRQALAQLVKDTQLNTVMIEAATRGSVGSVAILFRVLKNRAFFSVLDTPYLTPEWDNEAPDTLKSVTELRKVKGRVLRSVGYTVADDDSEVDFWFQRTWDANAETWLNPIKVSDVKDGKKAEVDAVRTIEHKLGFVPMVWVKNLPGGDEIDGDPTFPPEAVDTQIEADYLLSQGGRGLKYQSDPTLHVKEPAMGDDGKVVRGAANAIVTSSDGDAKLLEISGDAANTVMDWVKGLREIALEGAGGNRANADKLSAAQSGRAMELMNQALIWLADKLRISYGEGALMALLAMVIAAQNKFALVDKKGVKLPDLNDDGLALRWPAWYAPTYADKQTEATTMDLLRLSGLISQETALKAIAPSYDIDDVQEEIAQIKADGPPPNVALTKEPKPDPNSND
jgi:hypothetical protein